MPSGPKKRKAAKKKKEKEANTSTTPTTPNALGDDDSKQQDEKGSDSDGEVNSPASQDHHSQQHPFTEEEDEEVEKREIEVENVVQIDREVKPAQESIEPLMKSHDSSNFDDESHVEKNVIVVETVPVVDSVSEVITQVTDSVPVEDKKNSVVETVPVVDTDKVPLLEEVVPVNESVSVDNSVTSDVIESVVKENVEKNLPSLNENFEVSPVRMDLGSKENGNVVVSMSDNNAMTSSDARDLAAQERDDKLLMSYNAPRIDTSNGAEHFKESEVHESSDSEPLVASAPRPVPTTSWKGCCGLFEVLTGSSR